VTGSKTAHLAERESGKVSAEMLGVEIRTKHQAGVRMHPNL
jgi:hypothetical protein